MDELIESINKITGFRVELFYYSDAVSEGYKAQFYGDSKGNYQMEEVFERPLDAILRLAEVHELSLSN